jgi:hypothetical protein
MSDIEKTLKCPEGPQDFWISNEDRLQLIDILVCVSHALKLGKLWFNKPGPDNAQHAEFCEAIARRFANMPVEKEQ